MKYEFRYYKPESVGKKNPVENKDYISLMGCIDNHIWVRWLTNKRAAGKSSDECTYKELMKINTKTFNRILKRRGEILEIVNKGNPSTYIKNEIETESRNNCFQWVEKTTDEITNEPKVTNCGCRQCSIVMLKILEMYGKA